MEYGGGASSDVNALIVGEFWESFPAIVQNYSCQLTVQNCGKYFYKSTNIKNEEVGGAGEQQGNRGTGEQTQPCPP